ncbi:hypothetical protein GCM10011372_32910 [Agromyces bauzanensis]|uniref:Uncharacterized protein n=1 Tax=Agromyces bauzanensis TaxID=1308924 RepID=A0A917UWG5_9MICO|nr:hypothetical protein GCM10011372_32910 [Agromyces bauzanensis]
MGGGTGERDHLALMAAVPQRPGAPDGGQFLLELEGAEGVAQRRLF